MCIIIGRAQCAPRREADLPHNRGLTPKEHNMQDQLAACIQSMSETNHPDTWRIMVIWDEFFAEVAQVHLRGSVLVGDMPCLAKDFATLMCEIWKSERTIYSTFQNAVETIKMVHPNIELLPVPEGLAEKLHMDNTPEESDGETPLLANFPDGSSVLITPGALTVPFWFAH